MTIKEFDKIRIGIQKERYCEPFSEPIAYGIKRAIFEQQRFQRLIAEASKVESPSKAIRTHLEKWKRQQRRAAQTQQQLEKTRALISTGKIGKESSADQPKVAVNV